eukprot:8312829-Heterocapsa_arctica.AAC.1
MDDIVKQEEKVSKLRADIKNERSQRWRHWVDNSWARKKQDIYRWIRGNKTKGPLIVIPGGSAQVADILKEAEEAWGGLWAVEAKDLPEFEDQPMEIISEDEIIRVVNRLVDGKAKGVDGWSPADLRSLSRTHIQGLADLLNLIEKNKSGRMG